MKERLINKEINGSNMWCMRTHLDTAKLKDNENYTPNRNYLLKSHVVIYSLRQIRTHIDKSHPLPRKWRLAKPQIKTHCLHEIVRDRIQPAQIKPYCLMGLKLGSLNTLIER